MQLHLGGGVKKLPFREVEEEEARESDVSAQSEIKVECIDFCVPRPSPGRKATRKAGKFAKIYYIIGQYNNFPPSGPRVIAPLARPRRRTAGSACDAGKEHARGNVISMGRAGGGRERAGARGSGSSHLPQLPVNELRGLFAIKIAGKPFRPPPRQPPTPCLRSI